MGREPWTNSKTPAPSGTRDSSFTHKTGCRCFHAYGSVAGVGHVEHRFCALSFAMALPEAVAVDRPLKLGTTMERETEDGYYTLKLDFEPESLQQAEQADLLLLHDEQVGWDHGSFQSTEMGADEADSIILET